MTYNVFGATLNQPHQLHPPCERARTGQLNGIFIIVEPHGGAVVRHDRPCSHARQPNLQFTRRCDDKSTHKMKWNENWLRKYRGNVCVTALWVQNITCGFIGCLEPLWLCGQVSGLLPSPPLSGPWFNSMWGFIELLVTCRRASSQNYSWNGPEASNVGLHGVKWCVCFGYENSIPV